MIILPILFLTITKGVYGRLTPGLSVSASVFASAAPPFSMCVLFAEDNYVLSASLSHLIICL